MSKVYLDYAATTAAHPEVIQAMLPYFGEKYGNASSLHSFGQEARSAIEKARTTIAGFINAAPEEVIFTSGGTESDNSAILGIAYANQEHGDHIITSSIEHHAVIESCHFLEKRGFKVTYLPVDKYGMVNPDDVKKALTPRTILVTIMHASNEVGTIQPIAEIGKITRAAGVYFHTDAVQTFGHLPIDVRELNVDLLSVSGHKLCGPKGIGILFIRKGTRLAPFMLGGGQEDGRRGSTYNTPGIVGLGKAVEIAKRDIGEEGLRLSSLRDQLITGLQSQIDLVKLNGHPTKRLPNNVNISLAYVEGEATLLTLDFEGICASTGSACSSESMEPSHVLTAMRIPADEARCSIRFSLGKWTSQADIDKVLEVLPRIMVKLRSISPLYKNLANQK